MFDAPGMFLIVTGFFRASAKSGAKALAIISNVPPGVYGTTTVIGFVGHDATTDENIIKKSPTNTRVIIFLLFNTKR
jgi:hypothetical protein